MPRCAERAVPREQEGRRRIKASPDAEDLARFRAVSPIAHVDAVTAPLLFMLGAKDQRCGLGLGSGHHGVKR